jgi:hypothetical protein
LEKIPACIGSVSTAAKSSSGKVLLKTNLPIPIGKHKKCCHAFSIPASTPKPIYKKRAGELNPARFFKINTTTDPGYY